MMSLMKIMVGLDVTLHLWWSLMSSRIKHWLTLECQCQSLCEEHTAWLDDEDMWWWQWWCLEIECQGPHMESGSENPEESLLLRLKDVQVFITLPAKNQVKRVTITFETCYRFQRAESATVGEGCSTNLGTCDICQSMSQTVSLWGRKLRWFVQRVRQCQWWCRIVMMVETR